MSEGKLDSVTLKPDEIYQALTRGEIKVESAKKIIERAIFYARYEEESARENYQNTPEDKDVYDHDGFIRSHSIKEKAEINLYEKQGRLNQLLELDNRLLLDKTFNLVPAPNPDPIPTETTNIEALESRNVLQENKPSGRLQWLGNNSSWERVYEALSDAKLIPADPSAWACIFVDKNGDPMPPPCGGNAVMGNARNPTTRMAIQSIRSAGRNSGGC